MSRKPLEGKNVFLSGPMTGMPCNNLQAFISAHKLLLEYGAKDIFNPAFQWLHELEQNKTEKSHEYYMRKCISELTKGDWFSEDREFGIDGDLPARYDMLVRLDGWESSEGAVMESKVAEACGIQVVDLSDIRKGE